MMKELEQRIAALEKQIEELDVSTEVGRLQEGQMRRDLAELREAYVPRSAADRVYLARHPMGV